MATIREQLIGFLVARPRDVFCVACLARALGASPKRTHEATVKLEADPRVARRHGHCSVCTKARIVIGVSHR